MEQNSHAQETEIRGNQMESLLRKKL